MTRLRLTASLALACLIGCLTSVSALAGTATVSWQNPTQYTDGSSIAAGDITQTRVEYGSCGAGGAFGTKAGEFTATAAATSATSPNLAPGTYCFRAYTTAKGVESVASNVASKVVPQSAPQPPVLTTISVVAYEIRGIWWWRFAVAVGTVPLGTGCGAPGGLGALYSVPTSAVTLNRRTSARVFYGVCAKA